MNACWHFFHSCLNGDICRKPHVELTKLAKLSCKALSYGGISDALLDLNGSKMKQLKGIDAMKK